MGLRTVAVYSEADRDAMHVAMADEAMLLGPARARDSYLNIERVIEAARKTAPHWVDWMGGETEEQVGEDKIVAPLPGTVVALLAEEGATLERGAAILTLEVMKMEQTLRAPYAGVLKKIKCKVGDIVGEGVELAEVEPAAASTKRRRPHCRGRPARRPAEREDPDQRCRSHCLHRGVDRRRSAHR